MSRDRLPVFRPRTALAVLGVALAGALALAACAIALEGLGARLAGAQETELPTVPADSVSSDFLSPVPAAPGAPGVPPAPAPPGRGGGERTIEGAGGLYKIHAGKNDVVQMGEDIVVDRGEHVLGDVFAMGGSVTVRGIVDQDVVAMGGDVVLEDGAQVRGDAVSIGGQVKKASTASILGSSVSVGGLPRGMAGLQALNFVGHGVAAATKVFTILFLLVLGWLVASLTRSRSERAAGRIEQAPLAMLGWGVLGIIGIIPGLVAVALAAALLVVTIIGIPVAVLLLLGYCFAVGVLLLWGSILGATAVGRWLVVRLSPRLGSPELVRNTLVGIVGVCGLGLIGELFGAVGMVVPPAGILAGLLKFSGWLLFSGATCAGVGAILVSRAGQPSPLPPPTPQP